MFEGDKKTLIKYEMLKVLQSISKGGTYSLSLKEWEDKYQGVGLCGWGWAELDRWIGDMDDGDNKTKLLEAIEEFKTHK